MSYMSSSSSSSSSTATSLKPQELPKGRRRSSSASDTTSPLFSPSTSSSSSSHSLSSHAPPPPSSSSRSHSHLHHTPRSSSSSSSPSRGIGVPSIKLQQHQNQTSSSSSSFSTCSSSSAPFSPPISALFIGLNPAYQKILSFSAGFRVGHVNRAASLKTVVGGKGQNAVRAFNLYRGSTRSSRGLVVHFLGGTTGDFIHEVTKGEDTRQLVTWIRSPTRTCTTCIEGGGPTKEMTEIIEPSVGVSAENLKQLRDTLKEFVSSEEGKGLKAIGICGTFPPGVPSSFYADVCLHSKPSSGCILLMDAFRGVEEALQTGKIDILKINSHELLELSDFLPSSSSSSSSSKSSSPQTSSSSGPGSSISSTINSSSSTSSSSPSSSSTPCSLEPTIIDASARLFSKYPNLPYLCVTDGPQSAFFFANLPESSLQNASLGLTSSTGSAIVHTNRRVGVRFSIPDIRRELINPIGAGDACAGVMMAKLVERFEERTSPNHSSVIFSKATASSPLSPITPVSSSSSPRGTPISSLSTPRGGVFAPDFPPNSPLSILTHEDIQEAFQWGLGAAVASCKVLEPSVFTISGLHSVLPHINPIAAYRI
jgi:fructose-1-phosphate kinase PfkB-like protein